MEYSGNSNVQQSAEKEIFTSLSRKLGLSQGNIHSLQINGMKLDGCVELENELFLIEVWAHQGWAKTAQKHKLMNDACKLILAAKALEKKARKIICVSDEKAVAFLGGDGWQGRFMKEFSIEIIVVDISQETRNLIVKTQKMQDLSPNKSKE